MVSKSNHITIATATSLEEGITLAGLVIT